MAKTSILTVSELQNPSGLPKALVEAFIADLGRLAEVDREVARRTIRYVVDGTDNDVLLTLSGLDPNASQVCYFTFSNRNASGNLAKSVRREREKLLLPPDGADLQVWVRWSHVIDAFRRAAGVKQNFPAAIAEASWQFLIEISSCRQDDMFHHRQNSDDAAWSMDLVERFLRTAGDDPLQMVEALLKPGMLVVQFGSWGTVDSLAFMFSGWPEFLLRHIGPVRAVLSAAPADQRVHAMSQLRLVKFDFSPIVDLVVSMATSSAKTVREPALSILESQRAAARPLLEQSLADKEAGVRHEAVGALWRLFGAKCSDTLRAHLETESSSRVKQTIEKLVASSSIAAESSTIEEVLSLPPLVIETGVVPLSETTKQDLTRFYEQSYAGWVKQYEQLLKQWNEPNRPQWLTKPEKPPQIPAEAINDAIAFIEGHGAMKDQAIHPARRYGWHHAQMTWSDPGVKLIHLVRFANWVGQLNVDENHFWWNSPEQLLETARSQSPFGLRELDAVVASLPKAKPGMIANEYLRQNTRYSSFCDWEPEAIWPAFAERPEVLREVLGASNTGKTWETRDYYLAFTRQTAFKVLAMFPQLPTEFVPLLWDIALGETKADRPLAQAALAKVPDKSPKVIIALSDGKQTIRQAAAEWLGKLGDASAIEPLKEAFRKEKQEVVKGTIMAALDLLGADVNEFLDRKQLAKEAAAGLAKKRPKGMEWVPLVQLPELHWEDSGKAVPKEIVEWWVVQSIAQKTPACGPLLRRYLSLCRTSEAQALAKWVLSTWIAHDTRALSHEEAAAKATSLADQQWAMFSQHQYWLDLYKGNKENLFRQILAGFSNECLGSAINEKGMLAVVSAAGNRECVKLCEQFIRRWFGYRLAQCKALLDVLAWVADPMAIQVLLGIANRFKTKSLRQHAEELVSAIADREGWTLDELADRTIPDAGFARETDENDEPIGDDACLELDYGPRKFTVRLDDELEPVITREDGKGVKSPPAPGKEDDEEKAKAAKKAFSEAKKVVKEVVKRQAERLYEAVCTQRSWKFDDWSRYLNQHPIVSRLCGRLVWAAFEKPADGNDSDGRFLGCFRPLTDGSLTNEKDEEAQFDSNTVVRLAHTANVPAELQAAWTQHLKDYDVDPLFVQFGRETFKLSESARTETDLADFAGHQITTFKLRGKATKLGFIRGDAEDGGCFFVYRKPFPSLRVQAVLEFTGNSLPEEDRPAALRTLSFATMRSGQDGESSWSSTKMPLGKVPPVLLSECYNDVRQIAAEGTGFDPKWESKQYW